VVTKVATPFCIYSFIDNRLFVKDHAAMSEQQPAKDGRRRTLPECHEGKEATGRFTKALKTVLGVSKERITHLESGARKTRRATA